MIIDVDSRKVIIDLLEEVIQLDSKKLERKSMDFEETQFLRGRIDMCRVLTTRLSDQEKWSRVVEEYKERLRNARN